jgi:hypothetical protein
MSSSTSEEKTYVLPYPSERETLFLNALRLEYKNGSKFMGVVLRNADLNDVGILSILDEVKVPDPNPIKTSKKKFSKDIILLSIKTFLEKFDEQLFKSYKEHSLGVLTKCIWAIYRSYLKELFPIRLSYINKINRYTKNAYDIMKKEAATSRQVKIRKEMLALGNGNLNIGLEKFNSRKIIQKQEKYDSVKHVSDSLLKQFKAWLVTSNGQSYNYPFKTITNTKFLLSDFYSNNSIILNLNSKEAMNTVLPLLLLSSLSKYIAVDVTLEWDSLVDAYSYPQPYILTNDNNKISSLPLNGQKLLLSPKTWKVVNYISCDNKPYIVTDEKCYGVHKLFPKEYERLEYLNPRKSTHSHISRACKNQITRIKLSYKYLYNPFSMTISIKPSGHPTFTNEHLNMLLNNNEIKKVEQAVDNLLMLSKNTKSLNDSVAKQKGLAIQLSKDSTKKNCMNDLKDLCEMFKKNHITEEEFTAMKKKLMD